MSVYDVEEGIDFYKELYDNINIPDTDSAKEVELCMITNMPLDESRVSLICGHSYNYDAIFNDAKQIRKNNHIDMRKIDCYEIQCPYCRVRQTTLLPCMSSANHGKVHGVNWIDTVKVFGPDRDFEYFPEKKCEWKCNPDEICGQVNTVCDKTAGITYCYPHFKEYYHMTYKTRPRRIRRSPRTKMPTASKTHGVSGNHGENVVMSISTVPSPQFCQAVIKSGKRAGMPCGYKAKISGCCLIHTPP